MADGERLPDEGGRGGSTSWGGFLVGAGILIGMVATLFALVRGGFCGDTQAMAIACSANPLRGYEPAILFGLLALGLLWLGFALMARSDGARSAEPTEPY